VATTLFLGGWYVPHVNPAAVEAGGLLTMGSLVTIGVGIGVVVLSLIVGAIWNKMSLLSIAMFAALPIMIVTGFVTHAWQLTSFLLFAAKVTTLVFVIIWIRWTLPRFRVDQMMNICWKYFIPLSFVCFIATTLWVWMTTTHPIIQEGAGWAMFLIFGVGLFAVFAGKVIRNLRKTRLLYVDKQIDFNLFY
jgi:NADH:ubiquinone oxidoreductase subunit H